MNKEFFSVQESQQRDPQPYHAGYWHGHGHHHPHFHGHGHHGPHFIHHHHHFHHHYYRTDRAEQTTR